VRARVAAAWGCFPWDVDEAPWDEVQTAAELLALTGELASQQHAP
jgi:hypothetical protein